MLEERLVGEDLKDVSHHSSRSIMWFVVFLRIYGPPTLLDSINVGTNGGNMLSVLHGDCLCHFLKMSKSGEDEPPLVQEETCMKENNFFYVLK